MIDGSEKWNRQLAFELQNSCVCEKCSNRLFLKTVITLRHVLAKPCCINVRLVQHTAFFHFPWDPAIINRQHMFSLLSAMHIMAGDLSSYLY